jgi:protein-disulfide isomerase
MAAYPKDVKLIYKQFPLSMHPHAELAAEASLAAGAQGKFWEMYDVLFKNFQRLSRGNIMAMAKDIGLDVDKFKADLESGKFKKDVEKDTADGEAAGVYGTPSFYINGKQYNGEVSLAALKPIFATELKDAKEKTVAAKQ